MKQISAFHCLMVILLVLFFLPAQPVVAQTLANPGLEGDYVTLSECNGVQGEVALGWLDNTCWDSSASVRYAQERDEPHSGAAAQRIEVISGRVQFAQPLTFVAGQRYTVHFWLRAAEPLAVELLLRQTDAPYTTYTSRQVTLSTTWTRYTLAGAAEPVPGFLMVIATTPGLFWLDDVELSSAPFVTLLPDAAIPRTFFGMHIHRTTTPWPAVQRRIGALRLWDAGGPPGGAQWAEVNTSRGVYGWDALDAHVARALSHRADLVFNLGRTPQWASARPNEPSPYGAGQAAEPASDADWQAWVTGVGTRYRGKIRYWEIWNEPNDQQFYSGTSAKLVDLTRQAHTILKKIDPANRIVSPSAYSIDYLERYLALGGGAYVDIIGYHFYVDAPPEFLYATYIPNVRQLLEQHGQLHKPLWNTEAGWLRPTAGGPITLSDAVAVGYVARAYILNWASGVSRFYYYAWDNDDYMDIILTKPDHISLTPAGVAYGEIAAWLVGAQMLELTRDGQDTWVVTLIRPDGSKGYMLWNPTQTRTLPIPAEWQVVRQRELDGRVRALAGVKQVQVTASPILLEELAGDGLYLPLVQGMRTAGE
jgi:hypothetical protein